MRKIVPDNLPTQFVENVLGACGRRGRRWLNDLPQIVGEIAEKWSLVVENPFPNLSYNYVAPCVYAGGKAVLKIALPLDNPEIFNEARFLQMANAKGAVELLKSDENRRAILLERLKPGENLKKVCRCNEAKAVEIAISTARKLLKKPPPISDLQRLDEWFDNFFRKAKGTSFPLDFQNKACEFYEQLSSTSSGKLLIHGDLHHENILSATREPFLAIDPKGIVGDIGYEIAVFLNNHLWWQASEANLREKLNAAVERFSEAFEIPTPDLRKWAYAQTVLSAWWTFEENGKNWETDLAFAEFWEV